LIAAADTRKLSELRVHVAFFAGDALKGRHAGSR
jgi:hypothetical protein